MVSAQRVLNQTLYREVKARKYSVDLDSETRACPGRPRWTDGEYFQRMKRLLLNNQLRRSRSDQALAIDILPLQEEGGSGGTNQGDGGEGDGVAGVGGRGAAGGGGGGGAGRGARCNGGRG